MTLERLINLQQPKPWRLCGICGENAIHEMEVNTGNGNMGIAYCEIHMSKFLVDVVQVFGGTEAAAAADRERGIRMAIVNNKPMDAEAVLNQITEDLKDTEEGTEDPGYLEETINDVLDLIQTWKEGC